MRDLYRAMLKNAETGGRPLLDLMQDGAQPGALFEVVGWNEWGSKHTYANATPKMSRHLDLGDRIELIEVPVEGDPKPTVRFRLMGTDTTWKGRAKAACLQVVRVERYTRQQARADKRRILKDVRGSVDL